MLASGNQGLARLAVGTWRAPYWDMMISSRTEGCLVSTHALTTLANWLDMWRTPAMVEVSYQVSGCTRLGMFTWTAESYKDRAITVTG